MAGGAQTVTVTGNGFDATTVLTICGNAAANECVIDAATLTHSQFTCVTPGMYHFYLYIILALTKVQSVHSFAHKLFRLVNCKCSDLKC